MAILIQSAIWRDGGSLSSVVEDVGSRIGFWLETNNWMHQSVSKGHEHLFVSNSGKPQAKELKIEIASIEERQWLDYLAKVDVSQAEPSSKERFLDMVDILKARHTT